MLEELITSSFRQITGLRERMERRENKIRKKGLTEEIRTPQSGQKKEDLLLENPRKGFREINRLQM